MLKTLLVVGLAALGAVPLGYQAPAQSGGRPPVRIGGTIQPPEKIRHVDPVYPVSARAAGAYGIVIVELVVDEAGRVQNPRVLRSVPQLDAAAVAAVREWQYRPPRPNGTAGSVIMVVPLEFRPLPAGDYSTAPRITGRDFLTRVRQVELETRLPSRVLRYTTEARVETVVRESLAAYGIKIVPSASVRVVVEMQTSHYDFTTTKTTRLRTTEVERIAVVTGLVDLRFELTTPLLRGGRFVRARVAPASNWSAFIVDEQLRLQVRFDEELKEDVTNILAAIEGRRLGVDGPPRSSALDAAFASVYSTGNNVVSALSGIGSELSLTTILVGEADRYHTTQTLTAAWTRQLSSLGIAVRPDAQLEVRAQSGVLFRNVSPGAIQLLVPAMERSHGRPAYAHIDHFSIVEKDAVFNLDGSFVRAPTRLLWHGSDKMSEPDDVKEVADQLLAERLSGIGAIFVQK